MGVRTFVRDKFTWKNAFLHFATYLGTVAALESLGSKYLFFGREGPLTWALTSAFSALCFFLLASYCAYRNGVKQDEIDRMANEKRKLETAILKNDRRSSVKPEKKAKKL